MLLAQISDLHFLPKGTLAFGRVDVAGCLERAIDHLNALRPRPDAVLITGDLTSDGDAPVWAELTRTLARLAAPVFPLPGNHDGHELMRDDAGGRRRARRGVGRHGHLERVLCGHVHRTVQCRFAGTIGQIAPDTALETSLHRARADCCADRSCP